MRETEWRTRDACDPLVWRPVSCLYQSRPAEVTAFLNEPVGTVGGQTSRVFPQGGQAERPVDS